MNGVYERGEVYWVNLGTGFSSEKGVYRPGVVIANESATEGLNCVLVALTTTKPHARSEFCEVPIRVLKEKSWVMCNEIHTYGKERFGNYAGRLSDEELRAVEDALEEVFELGYQDDEALNEKDRQIEAKDATIAELKAQLTAFGGVKADDVVGLKVEIAVLKQLYDKAIGEITNLRFAKDLAKQFDGSDLIAPEIPCETAMPVDCRLDINHCTCHQLKKMGFDPEIADRIIRKRPFGCVEELKGVYGVTSNMYRLKSPMLYCTPFAPKVLEMTAPDAVNINQCSGKDLIAIGMDKNAAYKITSHRKRNGFFSSVEDLKGVRGVSQKCYDKFAGRLAV